MKNRVVNKLSVQRGAVHNFTLMIFSLFLIKMAIVLVMIAPGGAWAADALKTQVGFGDIGVGTDIKSITITKYFSAFYTYTMGLIGILSTVVIMWGGFIWITAGGNQARVSVAQSWIGASLSGLILALSAVVILNVINPKLTQKPVLNVETVTLEGVEECPNGRITNTAAECNEVTEGVCMNQGNGAVRTQDGGNGWCRDGSWNACKTAGTSCSNSIVTNYECCNGDCLSEGVFSGNICN